jgi:MbtH protein
MISPFEDPDAIFSVVVNDELQYTLWPDYADVPRGWTIVLGYKPRKECLAFVERHWTNLRPPRLTGRTSGAIPPTGRGDAGRGDAGRP